jgi:hypothetical protein
MEKTKKLTHKGKPVEATIVPDAQGGHLLFKCGMKKRRVPLHQVLANVLEPKPAGTTAEDLVDLRALEPRVAIMALAAETDEDEKALLRAKCALLRLVRGLRDERRADAGLPPVSWERPK